MYNIAMSCHISKSITLIEHPSNPIIFNADQRAQHARFCIVKSHDFNVPKP